MTSWLFVAGDRLQPLSFKGVDIPTYVKVGSETREVRLDQEGRVFLSSNASKILLKVGILAEVDGLQVGYLRTAAAIVAPNHSTDTTPQLCMSPEGKHNTALFDLTTDVWRVRAPEEGPTFMLGPYKITTNSRTGLFRSYERATGEALDSISLSYSGPTMCYGLNRLVIFGSSLSVPFEPTTVGVLRLEPNGKLTLEKSTLLQNIMVGSACVVGGVIWVVDLSCAWLRTYNPDTELLGDVYDVDASSRLAAWGPTRLVVMPSNGNCGQIYEILESDGKDSEECPVVLGTATPIPSLDKLGCMPVVHNDVLYVGAGFDHSGPSLYACKLSERERVWHKMGGPFEGFYAEHIWVERIWVEPPL